MPKRETKRERYREQLASGELVVRQMTESERAFWNKHSAAADRSATPERRKRRDAARQKKQQAICGADFAPDASERPSAGPAGRTYRGPCEPGADVPRAAPRWILRTTFGREVLGGAPLPQAGPAAGSRSLRERLVSRRAGLSRAALPRLALVECSDADAHV